MSEVPITIRLPKQMLQELREAAASDHYIDISEAVRGILRSTFEEHSDPYLYEIKSLRKDIVEQVRTKSQQIATKMLADELKKIKKGLGNED